MSVPDANYCKPLSCHDRSVQTCRPTVSGGKRAYLEHEMLVAKERLTEKELSLLQFWNTRRAERAMPERSDIRPEDLFPWIGFLHLLEPVDGGRNFRYAVFTTRTLLSRDRDLNRKCVSDWGDERVGFAMRLYGTVLKHARPVYSALPERHEEDWYVYSRICLPLGTGDTVTHILSMLTPREDEVIDSVLPTVVEL